MSRNSDQQAMDALRSKAADLFDALDLSVAMAERNSERVRFRALRAVVQEHVSDPRPKKAKRKVSPG